MTVTRSLFPAIWATATIAALADLLVHALDAPHPAWVDEGLHLLLPLALTLGLGRWLQVRTAIGALPPRLLVAVITGLGLGLGALWEIGEWLLDYMVPGDFIAGGETDLITDMMLDLVGALAAALLCWRVPTGPRAREITSRPR